MMKSVIISLAILSLVMLPGIAKGEEVGLDNPVDQDTFKGILLNVIQFFISLAIPGSVLAIIYGGFVYMTAGGDPAKIQKGTKVIVYAIIGLIIAVSAYAIVDYFLDSVFGTNIDLLE